MNTLASRILALTSLSFLAACASAPPRPLDSRHDDISEPTAAGDSSAATPTPTPPSTPIIVLVRDGVFSTLSPGGQPKATQLQAGPECADTMGIGSSSPVVSPDGKKIALTAPSGELVITDLETGASTALTRHGAGQDVCVQVTGWSADGRRLLFHLGEAMSEDATTPKGVTLGFFLSEEGSANPRHLPTLQSADLVVADGLTVLQVVDHPDKPQHRVLRRVSLTDLSATELATLNAPYAFGQLHLVGGLLAFSNHETLEVAPLGDLAAAKVLVKRPFAEAQWPRLSPDGQHLAWQEIARERGVPKPALQVTPVAGGQPLDLGALTGPTRIEVEWFDTTRLLVCDGQGVRLVALDGTSQPLAGPGACFVPRGAR